MSSTEAAWAFPPSHVRRRPTPLRLEMVLAALALALLAPMLLAVALWIWCDDRGSPFFGQRRIGLGGRAFRCWKFRSMRTDAEARLAEHLESSAAAREEWSRNHKLRDDPRITPFGSFLRRSSIDELPQLFNVVCGEMSLVGPRPIVPAEVKRYGRYFRNYCSVRPGMTGLWQVSGRSNTSYRRRVALDVTYARHRSPSLDGFVLMMTVPAVLRSHGAH